MEPSRAHFRAMGTDVELLAVPDLPSRVVDKVRAVFEYVECRLSRFRPDSELSRLNASRGRPFRASPVLWSVLGQALEAARASGGRFDPTVLDAVEAAGYRRSFDEIGGSVAGEPLRCLPDYRQVVLRCDGTVILEKGVRVDLGGLAKGWTVDTVTEIMQQECESWVVNAGGDLYAAGPGPDGRGWLVGIEDPLEPALDIGVIRVRNGAAATSSAMRRRWRTEQGWAHHLIDPAIGGPAATGLASVTVLAGTAATAEVLAKTVFLMGRERGLSYIQSQAGSGAVFISEEGKTVWSRRMEEVREA